MLLLLVAMPAQAQEARVKDTLRWEVFEPASDFLFATLKANFGKSDGENLVSFMNAIKKANAGANLFILEMDHSEFRKVHEAVSKSYCDFFPIATYTYVDDSKDERGIVSDRYTREDGCQVIVTQVPNNDFFKNYKEFPHQPRVTWTFMQDLEALEPNTITEKYIQKYTAFNLPLINLINELTFKGVTPEKVVDLEFKRSDRLLWAIMLWRYFCFSANYDLEMRKYTYE